MTDKTETKDNEDFFMPNALCEDIEELLPSLQKFFDGLRYIKSSKMTILKEEDIQRLCYTFNKFFWGMFYDEDHDTIYCNIIPSGCEIYSAPNLWKKEPTPNTQLLFNNSYNGRYERKLYDIFNVKKLDADDIVLENLRSTIQYFLSKNIIATKATGDNKHNINFEIPSKYMENWLKQVKILSKRKLGENFFDLCLSVRDENENYLWDFEKDKPTDYNWLHQITACGDTYLTKWLSAHLIYVLAGKMLGSDCHLKAIREHEMMLIIDGQDGVGKRSFLKALSFGMGDFQRDPRKESDRHKFIRLRNCRFIAHVRLKNADTIKNLLTKHEISARKRHEKLETKIPRNFIYADTMDFRKPISDEDFKEFKKRLLLSEILKENLLVFTILKKVDFEKLVKILPLLYGEAAYYIEEIRKQSNMNERKYNTKFETILTKYEGNKPIDFRDIIDQKVSSAFSYI